MILESSSPSTALAWVREDLDRLLEQIRLQLDNVAINPNAGKEVIGNTARHIEHLKLTFEALVLNGAALVLDEMITLCDKIRHYRVDKRDDAFAALMEAIVVIPSYLDRMQAGVPASQSVGEWKGKTALPARRGHGPVGHDHT